MREECARVRAAADPDPEATNRRLHAGRRLRRWTDGEGFWNLHAKGTPQAGALFNTVLDPIIDRIFKTARAHGRREHPDAYAFDALIHLAEHATGHCTCHQPTQPTRDDRVDATAGNGGTASHADTASRCDRARYRRGRGLRPMEPTPTGLMPLGPTPLGPTPLRLAPLRLAPAGLTPMRAEAGQTGAKPMPASAVRPIRRPDRSGIAGTNRSADPASPPVAPVRRARPSSCA